MRVHELAKALNLTTAVVLAAAAAAGIEADHTLDALTPGEESALRLTLTPELGVAPVDVPEPAVAVVPVDADENTPDAADVNPDPRYRLVRRAAVGSAAAGHVRQGETVDAATWAALPDWMRDHFDPAA